MNGMGFTSIAAAWLFALAIPLVAFYFLKLKRPRLTIPSLILWQQVLDDQRVNSPFQRFKRNLLLWLQLLLLALLVFGAMQPFWRGDVTDVHRQVVIIDRSASMGALDKRGGRSRLDEAKEKTREIIDNLASNQQVSIIAFSKTARQVIGFESNKRLLREAVNRIGIEDLASDLTDPLRMADAMATSRAFERVILFSDGNFPQRVDFQLPYDLDYRRLEPAGANLAITQLNARRSPDGGWNVFVSIQGANGTGGQAALELVRDGKLVGSQDVSLRTDLSQQLIFEVDTDDVVDLQIRLVPISFDSLKADNTAYLRLTPPRPLVAYVPEDLNVIRHALAGHPGIRLLPNDSEPASLPGDRYDLLIAKKPEAAPGQAHTSMFVGHVPTAIKPLVEIALDGTGVIDWRRDASLLRHVELGDLLINDNPTYVGPTSEEDLESLRYQVLAYGRSGPLIIARSDELTETFNLLFDLTHSTLPYRVGLPIMIANLVESATRRAGLLEIAAEKTGVITPLELLPAANYRIKAPDGSTRHHLADSDGILRGVPAPKVGLYQINRVAGGAETEEDASANGNASASDDGAGVGVALLSPAESLLAVVEEIQFDELAVSSTEREAQTDRPMWSWLAFAAMVILMAEWWLFHHRPGGGRR